MPSGATRGERMPFNRQVLSVEIEVSVGGEYPQTAAHGGGADEEIGGAALEAAPAAKVVVTGGVLIVVLVQFEIGVEAQVFPERCETFLRLRSAKQFSPNWSEHLDDVSADQACESGGDRVMLRSITAKELRPDAGVY